MKKIILLISINAALVMLFLAPVHAASFSDVKTPSWYSSAVEYVVAEGYMSGIGNGRFSPEGTVTRAQVVQILYAKEGKPAVPDYNPFSDVPGGKWFSQAVQWSNGKGIVAGYPDNTFRPDQAVTREQLVAILYKYAAYKGLNVSAKTSDSMKRYPDAASVSNYAKKSMEWALEKGLISGTEKGIEPKGTATRAQMAVIIKAYCKNIETDKDREQDNDPADSDTQKDDNPDNKSDEEKPGEVTPSAPSGDREWELPEDDG